jgi:hypothetical protein
MSEMIASVKQNLMELENLKPKLENPANYSTDSLAKANINKNAGFTWHIYHEKTKLSSFELRLHLEIESWKKQTANHIMMDS